MLVLGELILGVGNLLRAIGLMSERVVGLCYFEG